MNLWQNDIFNSTKPFINREDTVCFGIRGLDLLAARDWEHSPRICRSAMVQGGYELSGYHWLAIKDQSFGASGCLP